MSPSAPYKETVNINVYSYTILRDNYTIISCTQFYNSPGNKYQALAFQPIHSKSWGQSYDNFILPTILIILIQIFNEFTSIFQYLQGFRRIWKNHKDSNMEGNPDMNRKRNYWAITCLKLNNFDQPLVFPV